MRVLVTGGAGVLGSTLSCFLSSRGYDVVVLDVVRREEAWRLSGCSGVKYVWGSVLDVEPGFVGSFDVVFDASIGSADRPFANSNPLHALVGNVMPSLRLLEAVRLSGGRPIVVYPSSFNALYGHGYGRYSESTLPDPAGVYGWSKGAVELLYRAYARQHGLRVIITRTASTYGPKGRSDEFPHRVIIYSLLGIPRFVVRSPRASRLWTYAGDVVEFYARLFDRIEDLAQLSPLTLHVAGNRGDVIVENIELARMIVSLTGSDMELVEGPYEPGEIVEGRPISFTHDSSYTRRLLGWTPRYSLEEGLLETIEWFRENIDRYRGVLGDDAHS